MDKGLFNILQRYMIECMTDSAHDREHVYRVLYLALDIARHEENADRDIVIAACLLHDIGREAQYKNPQVCHAMAGAEMAYTFCGEQGFSDAAARHIKDCVATHRFRGDNPPESIEARILFDADKLDVTGTLGIARTLFYKGHVKQPLYNTDAQGGVLDGANDPLPSFLQEYHFKLKDIYDKFYTGRAREIAEKRRQAAVAFYESMMGELEDTYRMGRECLNEVLK